MSIKKRVKVNINGHDYIVEVGDIRSRPVTAIVDGKTYQVHIEPDKSLEEAQSSKVDLPESLAPAPITLKAPNSGVVGDEVISPMPGDILEVLVQPGEDVDLGQALCVLEAMKMKNIIRSERKGRIASVRIMASQTVEYGEVLVTFER